MSKRWDTKNVLAVCAQIEMMQKEQLLKTLTAMRSGDFDLVCTDEDYVSGYCDASNDWADAIEEIIR